MDEATYQRINKALNESAELSATSGRLVDEAVSLAKASRENCK